MGNNRLQDRPWLTVVADKGDTMGECANCQKICKEDQHTLDDAYGVLRLVCPHCEAVNLLDPRKYAGRGYTSSEMFLTLPTDHEMEMNKWNDTEITKPCTCDTCKKGAIDGDQINKA